MKKYHFLELLWSLGAIIIYGIPFLAVHPFFSLISELNNGIVLAFSIPLLCFLYIFILILVTGMLQYCIPAVKQGQYPLAREGEVLKWMIHAGIQNYLRIPGLMKIIHANPIFRRMYYALYQAKIDTSVIISYEASVLDPYFIEIAEGTKIGEWATIAGHFADAQHFIFYKVKIGKRVLIGAGCSIGPGVEIGDDALLIPYSRVLPNTKIPSGEVWGGTPARYKKTHIPH